MARPASPGPGGSVRLLTPVLWCGRALTQNAAAFVQVTVNNTDTRRVHVFQFGVNWAPRDISNHFGWNLGIPTDSVGALVERSGNRIRYQVRAFSSQHAEAWAPQQDNQRLPCCPGCPPGWAPRGIYESASVPCIAPDRLLIAIAGIAKLDHDRKDGQRGKWGPCRTGGCQVALSFCALQQRSCDTDSRSRRGTAFAPSRALPRAAPQTLNPPPPSPPPPALSCTRANPRSLREVEDELEAQHLERRELQSLDVSTWTVRRPGCLCAGDLRVASC
jgi:hypothetical protein